MSAHVGARAEPIRSPRAGRQTGNAASPDAGATSGRAHVGAGTTGDVEPVDLAAEARLGLVGMGWKPAIANVAVAAAHAVVGEQAPLEALIFEALRRCRRA
jgi:hypothetical protein